MPRKADFTKKTIETLRKRAGEKCSNPKCRKTTSGPSSDIEKSLSLGRASHIRAAQPGGPRYDKSQNEKERKSIRNAIWVCANCSDLIDKDPELHTADVLFHWKEEQEKQVQEEFSSSGDKSISRQSNIISEIIHIMRENSENLNLIRDRRIDDLSSTVRLISRLLPYELPGIIRGIPHYFDEKLLEKPEISMLREYIEHIYLAANEPQFSVQIRTNWEWQRVWFMAGNFWSFTGEWNKAIYHYEVLDEVDPIFKDDTNEISFEVFYKELNKGVVYYFLKKLDLALVSFNNALKLRPKNPVLLNNLGVIYGVQKEEKRAIKVFDSALKINPRDPVARGNRGIALEKLGMYNKALKEYDKVLKIQPDNIGILNNKGVVLKEKGKFSQSIQVLDKILSLEPDNVKALVNRGAVLQRLGKQEEALIWVEKALKIKPDYGLAWYNKGSNLQDLMKYDLALPCYKKAIEYSPELAEPHINKISVMIEKKEFKKSLPLIDQAINRFPDRFEFYVNKMTVQIQLGQYKEAEETFRQGYTINQESAELIANKAFLLQRVGRPTEALKYSKKALKLKSSQPAILYLESVLYFQMQDWRRSYRAIQRALKYNSNNKEYLELEKKIEDKFKTEIKGIFRKFQRKPKKDR